MITVSCLRRAQLLALCAALFLGGAVGEAGAQTSTSVSLPIAPGTRVRVKARGLVAPLLANYMQVRGDTAMFIEDVSGRGIWSFALSDITSLERTAGEARSNRRDIVRWGGYGAGAGLVLGLVVSASLTPDTDKKYSRPLSGLLGMAIGGTGGALYGSRKSSEKWVSVPMPRRISFLPHRGGATVGLGFTF
jgi:hypothetical protein